MEKSVSPFYCLICKKEFKPRIRNGVAVGKYCSKKCMSIGIGLSLKKNPNFKKDCIVKIKKARLAWSKKAKELRVIKKCLTCGKEMSLPRSWNRLKNCSPECFAKYQKINRVGKNAGGYINGNSFFPYTESFNPELKRQIRKRDKYVCAICKKSGIKDGLVLDVHHIDYDKNNSNINNLVTLCHHCHSKTNTNRKHWQDFFSNHL